ncbi:IclR family transcriptional regulator [Halosimplex rubrum]|uniref:IclR family transcriptional regulator n=1 Tax=Halosimplex rubrum TaxID=869889 RepID=A0A7D5T5D1_9EURY|nr:IclR family transcriptional regulator [Halosimplex rubrum]QLH78430.1 IclR family transcriptional regulator [Halosimplex rubrum]
MTPQSNRQIKTAQRVFDIIDCLHENGHSRLGEVADNVDLAKSTTHDYLQTLIALGFVKRNEAGYYLSLKILRYGGLARRRRAAYEESMPEISQLTNELREEISERGLTSHLAILEDKDVFLADFSKTDWDISTGNYSGGDVDVHSSELGKAVLAFVTEDRLSSMLSNTEFEAFTDQTITDEETLRKELETVRERGYAVNDEEEFGHIKGIGLPILFENDVLGSISVSGPKAGIEQDEETILELLQTTVENIELRLEHH